MSIPIVNMQPKPSMGEAFGQGLSGGLMKLMQQHRNEKAGEAMGLPKGFAKHFETPGEAAKAYSTLRQMQSLQSLQSLFDDEGSAPPANNQADELSNRFRALSSEGQRTGMQAMMGDEMGGPLSQKDALSAIQEFQQGTNPQQQVSPQALKQHGKKPFISPKHLISAAGTPLEAPLRTIYESQERKVAKSESIEKEPYVAAAKEYFKDLGEKQKKLPSMKTSLEAQMNSVMRGDVDPFSRGHIADIAKGFGAPAALVAPLETPGSKEFKTGLKTFLSSTLKDAFRGTTTGREIDLAEGLLAQAGVSRDGNLASIWLLQSQALMNEKEIELARNFRKQGVPSYDIPDMVAEQLEPYRSFLSNQYMEAVGSLVNK